MSGLVLHNVSFTHTQQTVPVLSELSLQLETGNVYRLDGKNGAGKTTLLKLLAGILQPSTGTVIAFNRCLYLNQDVFKSTAPGLTVQEHLQISDSVSPTTLEQLTLLNLDLNKTGTSFMSQLSGGQRQAVALIMAVASNAQILCLDEFISALDTNAAKIAIDILANQIKQKEMILVYTNHSGSLFTNEQTIYLD